MDWSGKKILVTGGAGHIGSHLTERLVSEGADVFVVDNLWRGKKEYLVDFNNKPIIDMEKNFKEWDLRNYEFAEKAVEGIDIVFHLADMVAGITYVFDNQPDVFRSNVLINSNMFTAAHKANVDCLIYVGAACAYPHEKQNDPLHPPFKEDDMYPAHPESAYGWGKLMGEYECDLFSKSGMLNTAILRLHNVYGPHSDLSIERSQVIPATIRKAIRYPEEKFLVWGSGDQSRSFIYVTDVIEGLLLVTEKGLNKGPIQIGTDRKTTINEIADMVINISGKKIEKEHDLTKPVGDFARAADTTMAKKILGWEPKVSMEEQLQQEFIKITYKILGFIPDEKHFKEHISTELYDFLIKHHITYERWRYGIKIIEHMARIEIRSQCLDQAIKIINKTKKNPTMEMLESKISKFDEKIIENFFQISIFLKMVKDIFESKKNATKNMTFAQIDQDYQYVKNINQFEPKTEEILRYSKIGIGHYLKYCGNISNFVQIRELSPNKIPKTNNSIREHLEILKIDFSVLKESLKHIPTEEEMRLYSDYSFIIEYLWFNSYSEFLDFLGEDPSNIERPLVEHQNESSRDEILKESKKYVNENGSRSFFEKILSERLEIKYIINFKSIEQFIEIMFPSNKEMMKKIWFDLKKNI
ncbi:MAG: NAD-dependent epimerase/dehydratase family protein [Thaumarchaeota archaeon]|nr:NAD-dependent epimerase/dehydratase family protein [Nitrososphaerota archaeon]